LSRVEVRRDVLEWALQRSGRSIADLHGKFPKIHEWLAGKRSPTLRQLENFAKVTLTPFGYLFMEKPPEIRLPIPHYRTINSDSPHIPSPNLIETVHTMQRRQAWMREFLLDEGAEPLEFVGSANREQDRHDVAERIRSTLVLDADWASSFGKWEDALRDLKAAMERSGILVATNGVVGNNTHRKLQVAEFRGFVLVDEYAPLVFVNGADGKAAQMFTLAHELAHVFLGSSAAFDLRELKPSDNADERACNDIAAEFLVPEAAILGAWPKIGAAQQPFQVAARLFKVSEIVVARRALDLSLIDREVFLEFYRSYVSRLNKSKKPNSGGSFYDAQRSRLGTRFSEAVVHAARGGQLSYYDAYRLTGLHGQKFERYAEHLGYGA
jgi:Zn-dependent peptidase ImmA (M78 family)